ncbi:MAG: tetratricopeptide repeat protein [Candidatus Aenigmatarchaeota archaeon]
MENHSEYGMRKADASDEGFERSIGMSETEGLETEMVDLFHINHLDPDYIVPWCEKGLNYLRNDEYKKAMECFERSISARKWDSRCLYWYKRGMFHRQRKELEKAKLCFEKAINSLLHSSNMMYDMKNHVFRKI